MFYQRIIKQTRISSTIGGKWIYVVQTYHWQGFGNLSILVAQPSIVYSLPKGGRMRV